MAIIIAKVIEDVILGYKIVCAKERMSFNLKLKREKVRRAKYYYYR